jgi:MoxR-like ATPase
MLEDIRPLLDAARLLRLQELVDGVVVPEDVSRYLVAIVRRTRELPGVTLGASPRASVHLQAAVRSSAILAGRRVAEAGDVLRMAPHVLAHRVISERLDGAEVIAAAIDAVPRPSSQDG